MFLRMVKQIIRSNRQVEDARVSLGCHKTFSIEESFRVFDINQNGRVSVDEITEVFAKHNIELDDVSNLVDIMDKDNDGHIDLREWSAAIKSLRPCRGSDQAYGLSVEQKNLYQRSWLEQIAALFSLLVESDREMESQRNQLALDGERLFNDMDRHNTGAVSCNQFAYWVEDNCGFHICDEDMPGLETTLDGSRD